MRKLNNSSGVTLAETLLVIALLAITGSAITGGITAAVNVYRKTVRQENAEVLCSTITTRIVTEIRGATDFEKRTNSSADGYDYTFFSHSGTELDGMHIGFCANDGKVMVGYFDKDLSLQSESLLFSDATYTDELKAYLSIGKDDSMATVNVEIKYDDEKLASQEVSVKLGD